MITELNDNNEASAALQQMFIISWLSFHRFQHVYSHYEIPLMPGTGPRTRPRTVLGHLSVCWFNPPSTYSRYYRQTKRFSRFNNTQSCVLNDQTAFLTIKRDSQLHSQSYTESNINAP
jgi:hypothetical protein